MDVILNATSWFYVQYVQILLAYIQISYWIRYFRKGKKKRRVKRVGR